MVRDNRTRPTGEQKVKTIVKPKPIKNEPKVIQPKSGTTTTNMFGETIKKPSQKNGGFIKLPTKPSIKRSPDIEGVPNGLIEEARKYKSAEEFVKAQNSENFEVGYDEFKNKNKAKSYFNDLIKAQRASDG